MSRGRIRGLAAAGSIALAAATSGCGFGAGEPSEGEATLTVTRDYGAQQLLQATEPEPAESETVIRMLDREAEIETRYAGGFVQSIEGIEGEIDAGRAHDWFFFVNGIESSTGAAEREVRGGDRVWWDYRDWTDALRTPAVVGSWPEPFLQASVAGERTPVAIECHGPRTPCDRVRERLAGEGVQASVEMPERASISLRLLVGPWARVRSDPLAGRLEQGPQVSGVFARFAERKGGGWSLELLDEQASVAQQHASGAGLVAGMREGENPPTWLVTGVDAAGVDEAVAMLDAGDLRDRYAVATHASGDIAVPVGAGL